ncbi:MAG: LVIVD repeat-containing protein [Candidatus Dormibacteria bacterium]
MQIQRFLGLPSLAAVVTAFSLAGVSPAPAADPTSGVPVQAVPSVVSPDEPIPGTAKNFTQVGHLAPPGLTGTTPAGMYGALAIAGNCAYLARRSYNTSSQIDNGLGVQAVNITDPTNPVYVGVVPGTDAAQSTAREVRAIDQYKLMLVLTYSLSTGGGVHGATTGSNLMQAFHINPDCTANLLGVYDMGPVRPHEFYTWLDPVRPGRVIAYVTTPPGGVDLEVQDFSSCATVGATAPASCTPTLLTMWADPTPVASTATPANFETLGNYLHSLSLSPDGKIGYMAFWDGGFFTVDTSAIADDLPAPVIIGQAPTASKVSYLDGGPTGVGGDVHSAVPVPGRPYAVLTDEEYMGITDCPFGWVHIASVTQAAAGPVSTGLSVVSEVSSYGLPENLLLQESQVGPLTQRTMGLAPADTCMGYTNLHPGYIGASSAWPGGQIPANTYSSHNPTVLPDLVLMTWYGGGFQAIDITTPEKPAEAGYFVPNPEPTVAEPLDDGTGIYFACYLPGSTTRGGTGLGCQNSNSSYVVNPLVASWSYPIIKDGYIYFADNRNGLYVLKYTGANAHFATELQSIHFLEGNSNQGDAAALNAGGGAQGVRAAGPELPFTGMGG